MHFSALLIVYLFYIGSGVATLTINGTGFTSDMEVFVGKENCSNVLVSGDSLTCDVDLEKRGTRLVNVYVIGQGKARGNATYEFVSEVTGISPTDGHLAGEYFEY